MESSKIYGVSEITPQELRQISASGGGWGSFLFNLYYGNGAGWVHGQCGLARARARQKCD